MTKTNREEMRNRRRQGMTLIEVIVALAILGFGMLAMAAAQLSSLKFTDNSRERSEAYYLAQQQMEAFQVMSPSALEDVRTAATYPNDTANPLDPDAADATTAAYFRSWTITPNSPEAGVYTVRVQVTWTGRHGINRSIAIEGYKAGV